MGRFLLSAGNRLTDCGRFAATLSIRSGHGTGTRDRVYRFAPLFPSAHAAEGYALAQGLAYLSEPVESL